MCWAGIYSSCMYVRESRHGVEKWSLGYICTRRFWVGTEQHCLIVWYISIRNRRHQWQRSVCTPESSCCPNSIAIGVRTRLSANAEKPTAWFHRVFRQVELVDREWRSTQVSIAFSRDGYDMIGISTVSDRPGVLQVIAETIFRKTARQ